jgi:large repetitive protein
LIASGLHPTARRLALLAALFALPLALGLVGGARPATALVSCQGTFSTAGETACQIPANAATITITTIGGAGGAGLSISGGGTGGAGGNADQVQATFSLPLNGTGPAGTLYVEVAGAGVDGANASPGAGGANGGGNGGSCGCRFAGGGGGGASDVRTCASATCTLSTSDTRQIVAGGGGGGGGATTIDGSRGGDAGGSGTAGTLFGGFCTNAAQGGTASNAGGTGGAAASGGVNCTPPSGNGGNGSRGSGGTGGTGPFAAGPGGGGGGGYGGGGGGGGSGFGAGGAGGGGGTDFVAAAASSSMTRQGFGTGAGSVTIAFTFLSSASLTSAPNPSTTGQPVTFTATVTCNGGITTPTGTVKFTIDSTPGTPVTLASGVATFTTSSLSPGSHTATATYNGDANCQTSTSNSVQQVVKVATTTNLTSAPNPSNPGQPVTFTATVTCTGFTPTGTVTFTIDSTSGTPVTLASGVATFTTSSLSPGSHPATAAYSGDSNCAASTSTGIAQMVNMAGADTTLTSAPNPSSPGQAVTFTATVTCTGFTSTGTVTFTVDGAPVSPVPLSASTATFTTSSLSPGSHTVSAAYSGNANCAASTSNGVTQTVNQSGATLTSPAGPSMPGQAVTLTATITCPNGSPSGTVTFFDNGSPIASLPLNIKANPPSAAFTTSTLSPGSHTITAAFSGGGGCPPATSNAMTQIVGAAVYNMLLTSSQNPSTPGQPVTFTATPSCPGFTPTGIVTFTIDGVVGSPVKLIGEAASLTLNSLAIGIHSVTASYSGDGNCGAATSAVLTQMVGTVVSVPQPGDSAGTLKNCQSLPAAEQQACFGQALGNLGTSNPTPLPTLPPGSYCTLPDKSREWVPQGATAPAGCV